METADNVVRHIEEFLNYLAHCEQEYKELSRGLQKEDLRCQDLLHELELNEIGWFQKQKWILKLKKNRMDRRAYKDQMQALQPLMTFAGNAKNKTAIEHLKQALGETRKIEKTMQNRTYRIRVKEHQENGK